MDNAKKYKPGYYNPPETTYDWVKKDHIEKAPYWCSVDLRDGNQALVVPMSLMRSKVAVSRFRTGNRRVGTSYTMATPAA